MSVGKTDGIETNVKDKARAEIQGNENSSQTERISKESCGSRLEGGRGGEGEKERDTRTAEGMSNSGISFAAQSMGSAGLDKADSPSHSESLGLSDSLRKMEVLSSVANSDRESMLDTTDLTDKPRHRAKSLARSGQQVGIGVREAGREAIYERSSRRSEGDGDARGLDKDGESEERAAEAETGKRGGDSSKAVSSARETLARLRKVPQRVCMCARMNMCTIACSDYVSLSTLYVSCVVFLSACPLQRHCKIFVHYVSPDSCIRCQRNTTDKTKRNGRPVKRPNE
jgi:hypothetical protein